MKFAPWLLVIRVSEASYASGFQEFYANALTGRSLPCRATAFSARWVVAGIDDDLCDRLRRRTGRLRR